MELNIKNSYLGLENKDNLKNLAKNILNKQGSSKENMDNIVNKTVFDVARKETDAQFQQLVASSVYNKILIKKDLKNTFKYLNKKAEQKLNKKHIFGEFVNFENENEEIDYKGELSDFIIDSTVKNIFEAA